MRRLFGRAIVVVDLARLDVEEDTAARLKAEAVRARVRAWQAADVAISQALDREERLSRRREQMRSRRGVIAFELHRLWSWGWGGAL